MNFNMTTGLDYPDLFLRYADAMSQIYDLTSDQLFREASATYPVLRIDFEQKYKFGVVTIDDIFRLHPEIFGAKDALRIDHLLRFYSYVDNSLLFANNSSSFSTRDVLHEKVMAEGHALVLEEEVGVPLPDFNGNFDPSSYFNQLAQMCSYVINYRQTPVSMVSGNFNFTLM